MWESENELCRFGNGTPASSIKADGFHFRDHSWHVDTDIPSDFLVQIGDVSFHLHKYPLLSKCGKMNRIVYEDNLHDASEHKKRAVVLDDLPGGAESFELAAKFCYGVDVDHTVANISGLRCAAEYLEMTEDLEEGNLIFKTEAFLSYVVLSSWRDSIIVLKSCERLSPWAENLQIVRRCSESIAWKACTNPKGIRWPLAGKPLRVLSPRWTDSTKDSLSSSPGKNQVQVQVPPDWWFDDVSILRIDHFVRVVAAIKVKGMSFELIGEAIMHYAVKWLPGLIREGILEDNNNTNNGGGSSSSSGGIASWKGGLHMMVAGAKEEVLNVFQAKDQRMIVESLISIIPHQRDIVPCGFLLRLLGMANMLKVAPALVTELEKRAGMQFEQATLADLLVPSYNMSETLYDIDLVQRLLEHFLVQEQAQSCPPPPPHFEKQHGGGNSPPAAVPASGNGKIRVARLVDSYLTEVSRDKNLSLTKFQILAEALPESARSCDDGLYRAIDSYLKAHPTMSEHERKRLCRVMDCQKLSIDACMHAAQNERLPLRVVVQILFSEQVKISNAIANKEEGESDQLYQAMVPSRKVLLEGTPRSFQEGWIGAKKDINTLKFELESVKAKHVALQNEMEILQRQFDKMNRQKGSASAWSSGWKKLAKLTKTSQQTGHGNPQSGGERTKKATSRRWRNSIS